MLPKLIMYFTIFFAIFGRDQLPKLMKFVQTKRSPWPQLVVLVVAILGFGLMFIFGAQELEDFIYLTF